MKSKLRRIYLNNENTIALILWLIVRFLLADYGVLIGWDGRGSICNEKIHISTKTHKYARGEINKGKFTILKTLPQITINFNYGFINM